MSFEAKLEIFKLFENTFPYTDKWHDVCFDGEVIYLDMSEMSEEEVTDQNCESRINKEFNYLKAVEKIQRARRFSIVQVLNYFKVFDGEEFLCLMHIIIGYGVIVRELIRSQAFNSYLTAIVDETLSDDDFIEKCLQLRNKFLWHARELEV